MKPLSKLNTWAAKPPSDWHAPDTIPPALSPVWKVPPLPIPGWLPIRGYLSFSEHCPCCSKSFLPCSSISAMPDCLHLSPSSWLMNPLRCRELDARSSSQLHCCYTFPRAPTTGSKITVLKMPLVWSSTATVIPLKVPTFAFSMGDTWDASQLKFHAVWSFVCYEITHSFPVGTLQLSCSSFSPVKVSLYWKHPLPFFADRLYCSPAAWGV